MTTWRLDFGNGGWVGVEWNGSRILVRMQRAQSGDRLEIAALHVERPSAELLRSIRLATIEAMLNGAREREAIESRLDIPAPDLPRYYATTFGSERAAARALGYKKTQKRRPKSAATQTAPTAPRVRLARPSSRLLDDAFYGEVATAYRSAVAYGFPPRATLAADSGAPRATVTRWINEARQRGLLGAARHGRAGEFGEGGARAE